MRSDMGSRSGALSANTHHLVEQSWSVGDVRIEGRLYDGESVTPDATFHSLCCSLESLHDEDFRGSVASLVQIISDLASGELKLVIQHPAPEVAEIKEVLQVVEPRLVFG